MKSWVDWLVETFEVGARVVVAAGVAVGVVIANICAAVVFIPLALPFVLIGAMARKLGYRHE